MYSFYEKLSVNAEFDFICNFVVGDIIEQYFDKSNNNQIRF